MQHPVLLPPQGGESRGPLFRQHSTDWWVWPEPSTLCTSKGRFVQCRKCVCWGTKSLNLGVAGQLGGEVPVLGFPHIRWGK